MPRHRRLWDDRAVAEILTERLLLRPFDIEDLHDFVAYRRDPEIARYQTWDTRFSMEDALEIPRSQEGRELGEPGAWYGLVAIDRRDGTLHGDLAARVLPHQPAVAEVGITFARASQGRGLATEAMGAFVSELFDRLAMHRVHAETDERNGAVHRLFERLGFREEGRLVEADWCKGEWVTLRLYAVLAREWATRPR
jgi:RimJ/RimL family protein N-acetyltransferase